ncbi:MAG: iron-binding protein [Methanomassiliicoccus sp.]|nr:iron-binding protein [Methanomassiliicoccus sp.]
MVARDEARIKVCKNGPYLVTGKVPLIEETTLRDEDGMPTEWSKTRNFPEQETYTLCRCGSSKKAPYCDMTHLDIGFEGKEKAPRDNYIERSQLLSGPGLDMRDRTEICARAQFCQRSGGVWKLVQGSSDPSKKDKAIEIIGQCSAGRLVAYEKQGPVIEPQLERIISVTQDPGRRISGPLWVKGGIPVESADGFTYERRNRVTLCRCGRSKIHPFCDGTHLGDGFDDGTLQTKHP